jgi:GNAT superfamily N-acetyltransferase
MTSVKVREAGYSDVSPLARVHTASWHETYTGLLPASYLRSERTEANSAEEWREFFSDSRSRRMALVAERGGRICGFAAGGDPRDNILGTDRELYAIYVLRTDQTKGIGASLLRTAAARFVDERARSMGLWVLTRNPSRLFYDKMGGLPHRSRTVEIGSNEFEETGYVWRLD